MYKTGLVPVIASVILRGHTKERAAILYRTSERSMALIAAGFLELQQWGAIAEDSKKRAIATDKIPNMPAYLGLLFGKVVGQKPQRIKKHVEDYLAGFSRKPLKDYAAVILASISKNNEKREEYCKQAETILKKGIAGGCALWSEKEILLAILLYKGGLTKVMLTNGEQKLLKQEMKIIKSNESYRMMSSVQASIDMTDIATMVAVTSSS